MSCLSWPPPGWIRSRHVLASAIVTAARRRELSLEMPEDVVEEHGYGLRGWIGPHDVRMGKTSWVAPQVHAPWLRHVRRRARLDGSLTVCAAVDGEPAARSCSKTSSVRTHRGWFAGCAKPASSASCW